LNEEAGRLLQEDYQSYERHARLMTSVHAQPKRANTPLTTSGANAGASGESKASVEVSSPVKGKAKPEAALKAVKKSLKRL
jgi:ubiquitin-conjugating enzyme E2 S